MIAVCANCLFATHTLKSQDALTCCFVVSLHPGATKSTEVDVVCQLQVKAEHVGRVDNEGSFRQELPKQTGCVRIKYY